MYLVNTITTGGNLAAGTLGTLNISSANFNVGNGGHDSDSYMFILCNELILLTLNFLAAARRCLYGGNHINLKDVAFPSTADVILKVKMEQFILTLIHLTVVGLI